MFKTKHDFFISVVVCISVSTKMALSDSTHECPSDWQSINGDCFYKSEMKKKWKEANKFCVAQEGTLAQPTSDTQVRDLGVLLEGLGDREKVWVGGRIDEDTSTYKWLNGSEVTAGWFAHQPTTYQTNRCVAIVSYSANSIGLSVWSCTSTPRRFICQISGTTTISTSTSSIAPSTAIADNKVLWYVAGGIGVLVLLLILAYIFFLLRHCGRTTPSGNAVRPTSQHQYSDPDEVIPPASHQGNAVRPSSHHHQYSDPDELIPSAAHQGNITGSNIDAIYEDADVLPTPVYPGNITYSNIGTSYEEPIVLPTPVYPGDSANNYLILQ